MTTIDLLIERRQLSLADLANRSNISEERVEAIALGRWLPSPSERSALAAALETTVEDIQWGHFMNPRNIRYRQYGLKEIF